ncbi:MAG: DUF4276 family protein, partial [Candidatus Methylomirabilis sp.]|nr:DUF4276 family protein [Deltaproteobacteria bacterium]
DVDVRVVVTRTLPGGYSYRGGISKYEQIKRDLDLWLCERTAENDRFTTMIDLYRLPRDFPGWSQCLVTDDPYERVARLEKRLGEDVDSPRFVPYIQLHEFEALILADPCRLTDAFPDEADAVQRLVCLAEGFPTPEHIDEGDETAPSKRIFAEIPDYKERKASAGPMVAESIGLACLRARCTHFGEWLGKLEALR